MIDFAVTNPVVLTSDQPLRLSEWDMMPAGCIGYVTRIHDDLDLSLIAIDFGQPFGEIWCNPKNVGHANADFVKLHWRLAGLTSPHQ